MDYLKNLFHKHYDIDQGAKTWWGAVTFLLLLAWVMSPAPYSPFYQIRCLIQTPTAYCADGTKSFGEGPEGLCSTHGGEVIHDANRYLIK